jgi:1,5-anhydro-D-fructose reductase (1,5-anhydro-D-mannitol-forming)
VTGGRNARLRWGLIGASTIADEYMIDAIRDTGGRLRAVYSRSDRRAAELAVRHDIEIATDDLQTVLALDDLDAVFVSSTNDRHHRQVLAAAAAGKHILCEKPIAMAVGAAREMIGAADGAGVVLAVNHQQREHTAIRALRSLIADGSLGTIRAVRLQHATRLRDDLRTWRLDDRAAGAGVELDLTVHDADLVRFLFGTEVTSVIAMAHAEDGAAADTSAMAVLSLSDSTLVSLHEGFNTPFAQSTVEVHGDRATAVCVGHVAQTAIAELWLTSGDDRRCERVDIGAPTAPYVGVLQAFGAAVADGVPPSATGEDGLRSLQIALAVHESARNARPSDIDLGL